MPPGRTEHLWRYAALTRLWSWSLVGSAAGLAGLSVLLQAGASEGLTATWFATFMGMIGITGVVFYPLLRMWLQRASLPSLRLERAARLTGPRRPEAGRRDWRRWAIITALVIFVGAAMMMTFLVGVLGRGGTAEGVVIGTLVAWGVVTLEDARRIDRDESQTGRRYYAACARPVAIADRLVWTPGPSGAPDPGGAALPEV